MDGLLGELLFHRVVAMGTCNKLEIDLENTNIWMSKAIKHLFESET